MRPERQAAVERGQRLRGDSGRARGAGSQFGHQCWARCPRGVLSLWQWKAPGLRGPGVAGAAAFVVHFSRVKAQGGGGPATRLRRARSATERCVLAHARPVLREFCQLLLCLTQIQQISASLRGSRQTSLRGGVCWRGAAGRTAETNGPAPLLVSSEQNLPTGLYSEQFCPVATSRPLNSSGVARAGH